MALISNDFLTESLLGWSLLLFENLLDIRDIELNFIGLRCGVFGGASSGNLLRKMVDTLVQLLVLDCSTGCDINELLDSLLNNS